ncbi:Peptidase family S58 [Paraliobacillus sp. PM-2]|uniref:P1 family peptidase n=1 Tax=Paraliobacillus sp. PM-2 TaxID=1462524 RepID=UPI00061CAC65|nr:P1 family peptidase [Paraliobacillus sp. PM-2]CQR46631.1 Peptidase family S58 [Paraliobacillus sp. PM-2]
MLQEISIGNMKGFSIGHAQYNDAATGCTVIINKNGAVTGVDVRGGSPGTRETDLLKSENLVQETHAVFLSGGSAYGLGVADGIMDYLEEKKIGFDVGVARVPIVPGAILFDLALGDASVRPDATLGYQACLDAETTKEITNGSIGAGTGATVGKCLGTSFSMKGGLGTFAIQIGELQVGAVVAVNSFGDILDPQENQIIAGAYDRENKQFLHTEKQLLSQLDKQTNRFSENTSIGTIITNANATKAEMNKIASIAHDGFARTMRPSHTLIDGDTIFAMTSNKVSVDLTIVGMLAVQAIEQAVINGIKQAHTVLGQPSYREMMKNK